MESQAPSAPPSPNPNPERPAGTVAAPAVVAVVVTHNAGPWFEETLASIAASDYPNLSVLVIDAASTEDPLPRVASVLPSAYVRRIDFNPGYGGAANEVLQVVQGAQFFAFCHDDILVEPTAIRLLVEESFRSNAGIVGPKLVAWGRPEQLLQVGMSVDKTGVPAPFVETGELDQEQHDRVRDVFWIPGACTLVRADLFESLGGFDPAIDLLGEDLDLCWRANVAGARVMIVPNARVQHLEALGSRRPVDDRRRLQTRHRLRTVLTCYGPFHLLRVLPQAALFAVIEVVYAVAAGHMGQARDIAGAWSWNLRRLPELRRARRRNLRLRQVPDSEVRRLQVRGSARLSGFVRGELGGEDRLRALAGAGRELAGSLRAGSLRTSLSVWGAVVVVFLLGSRELLTGPLPAVGSLVPFPDGPTGFLREYVSGWRATGLGGEAPAPTAFGILGGLGTLFVGAMGQLQKVLVLGALPVGYLGAWRLAGPIGSRRARAVALVVYAGVPLPYGALSEGRWGGLLLYAAAPWILARLLRATRLEPFAPAAAPATAEVAHPLSGARPGAGMREVVGLGVVLALVAAFVPFTLVLVPGLALAIVAGSLVAGGVRAATRGLAVSLGAAAVAAVLHIPWSLDFLLPSSEWSATAGVSPLAVERLGIDQLLRFELGSLPLAVLGWSFLVAGALPVLVGTQWRLAWATRLWSVALASWGLAWAASRGWLPVPLPTPDVLLAPAAAAMALSVALGLAAFELDLPGYRFGWRQVASIAAAVGVVLGVAPALVAAADGRWHAPDADFATPLAFVDAAAADDDDGDFRVLWLGNPEVLPLSGWQLGDELAYGTSESGLPDARTLWSGASEGSAGLLGDALQLAAAGDTRRLGRLLAPLGVRYVVVPSRLAPASTGAREHRPPAVVDHLLGNQLDLLRDDRDPALLLYENTAWAPVRAQLPGPAAEAARSDDPLFDVAARTDLGAAAPVLTDGRHTRFRGAVDAGTVYVAERSSSRWRLSIDGEGAERFEAFGWANGFDVPAAGVATLRYDTPVSARVAAGVQVLLWLTAVALLVRGRRDERSR